jgi:outer membrane lipoprotein-sorting protein
MRCWVLGLAVALVVAGSAVADEKAEAVVKKAIDAHGGADALNKYKAGKFKLKGEISVMGMEFEFTGTVSYMTPDRYKLEVNAEIMGMKLVINQVVKGDSIKSSGTIGGMQIPMNSDAEKQELKMAAVLQEAEQLTPLLDAKKFTIKAGDDDTVNGKKASLVIVTPKAIDKELKIYFDKESGLVVKTAHKGLGPGEGAPTEVLEETYHTEYKKVSGVQTATKLTVTHDGKKFMTMDVSDIELLEKIDDKEFTIDD